MSHVSSPGPWGCYQCGTDRNFAWRSECRQCGNSAPNKWLQWQKLDGKKSARSNHESWPELGNGPVRIASNWWGPQVQAKQAATREATAVERCLELLALAKNMDDHELIQRAEAKLEAARAQRDAAVAPSTRRDRAQAEVRRLESRVAAKRKLRDEAGQELAATKKKWEKAEKDFNDMVEQLSKAQKDLAAAAQMAAIEVATDRNEAPADIAAVASEVQRLECIVQSLSKASPDNLPAVGESLRAIVAALSKAVPQASNLPITSVPIHATETDNGTEVGDDNTDDEVNEFMDTFEGLDVDGDHGTGGHGSEQRRIQLKQFLAKSRRVKVRSKRPHG